jgi:hypothetical protein
MRRFCTGNLQQESPFESAVTLIDKWRGFLIAIWRRFGDCSSVGSSESQEFCIGANRNVLLCDDGILIALREINIFHQTL